MTIPFDDLLAMVPVQERKSAEALFAAILGPQPDAEADIPELEAVEGLCAGIDSPRSPHD